MPRDSTNLVPPDFGPTQPVYPPLEQFCRVTAQFSGNVYSAFTQQYNTALGLSFRDREPCYVFEPNGIQLGPGLYDCRLVSNFLGLPLYAANCCPGGSFVASSSPSASALSLSSAVSSPSTLRSSPSSSSPSASSSPAPAILFLDTFHDPDGTELENDSPDIHPPGVGWIQQSGGAGSMAIFSNTANNQVGGAVTVIYTINAGQSDVTVTGVFTSAGNLGTTDQSDVIFRYQDINNFWLCQCSLAGNLFRILEKKGGSFTTIQSTSFTFAINTQYTVKVVCSGSSINCTLNGGNTLSTTSSDFQTATIDGIFDSYNSPAAASTWSKFEVTHP